MLQLQKTLEIFPQSGRGRVIFPIDSDDGGRIRFQGTDWPAQFYPNSLYSPISIGTTVTVVGRQGIVMLVQP